MLIYKILRDDEWQALQRDGRTEGAPVDREDGYIHFSTGEQVAETLEKHFAGEAGLWLIAVEADGLGGLRWEPARDGALFPHLYRALALDEVESAVPVDPEGAHPHTLV